MSQVEPGCPFCGESESEIDEISPSQFAVVCQNPDCGAIGPAASLQMVAVNLWNHRVNRMDWPVEWLPMPDEGGHIQVDS